MDGYKKGQAPPRYVGGLKGLGGRNLETFVSRGGTLVCMNQSSDFAINELHLPVFNRIDTLERKAFFTGGSIMEVKV